MTDNLEWQIKEALCCDVDDVHQCAEDKHMTLFVSLEEVAPRIAAALRAVVTEAKRHEWAHAVVRKTDRDERACLAAGLAALKGGTDG